MTTSTIKRLRLRRPDSCSGCEQDLAVGDEAGWDKVARTVTCLPCLEAASLVSTGSTGQAGSTVEAHTEVGDPGASLQREYDKRVAAREARVRDRHPRIGGLLLAVTDEPSSTKAFARGADGERRVAVKLEKGCGDRVLFLHNRRRGPGKRSGDIDHLAVAPSGVWVIDAKNYVGAKVDVEVTGGLFGRPRREKLMIRGRDKSSLVASLAKQEEVVGAALTSYDVKVRAMFCFIGAELPWLRVPTIQGYPCREIVDTRKQLRVDGPLDGALRREIWELLARTFLPA